MNSLSELVEDVLSLIFRRRKVTIKEIQDELSITEETAGTIIDFLMRFGFAHFDNTKRYIRLSEECRRFVES